MLVFDKEFECYQVLHYKPLDTIPSLNDLDNLKVAVYHTPINKNDFKDPKFLNNTKVLSDDLMGYHEYLRQTQEPDYYISLADGYYQAGLQLTDEKKHYEAIDSYSKAIDNRAFCKMDLGVRSFLSYEAPNKSFAFFKKSFAV